jgi:membrane protease YdiL (CAAX protease family)
LGIGLLGPIVIVAAPLGEETLFRGFLYQGLRTRLSVWPAALASGLIFGLVHGYWQLIPALFVVGAGLALVYERRDSLLASMTAHATFNLFGFLLIVLFR